MIRERLIRWLGGAPAAPAPERRIAEAAAGVTRDEPGWTRLGADDRRDLSPITQDRMQLRSLQLWERNLLARQIVELPIAYLLAEGVRVTADDTVVQSILDDWWRDPITDFPRRLPTLMRDARLTGEVAWPMFVAATGHVRVGWLDPCRIDTVVKDPGNASQPIGVITARDARGQSLKYQVTVGGPETVFAAPARRARREWRDGDILYWQFGAPAGAARGRSVLLAALDWLDAYERHLYGEIDRAEFMRAYVWDVTLAGATADEVAARAKSITAPAPGSVRVHNEAESWQAAAPSLGTADLAAASRLFRNHLLGGTGLPEHWFGGGGDVNRATAAEMGSPTYKLLAMEQRAWTEVLRRAAEYAVSRANDPSGQTWIDPMDPDTAIRVEWLEMVTEDTSRFAAALAQAVGAAAAAMERGLLSEATAVGVVVAAASRLGLEIDPEAELAAAQADAGQRAERQAREDSFMAPPPEDEEDAT